MANIHSHAFQRGFSGLTEKRGAGRESFWTWRQMMYRLALTLDPDGVEALAALAYVEMLEAGFTRVGEFHYLHHDPNGTPYANPAELSSRIFAAAQNTGISLTHLPVFYAHGGFGSRAPDDGQRRFLHGVDAFVGLVETCDHMARPQDRVGFAPHSLRAATTQQIGQLHTAMPGRPVHIHVAEQVAEVQDCLRFSGLRPVEYLLNHVDVDARWCLIHATHLTEAERRAIIRSGAVAGLCPVTEANLGDGVFPAEEFLAEGGRFGIGTDSNIRIDLAEELRILEYGQRLSRRERNVLALPQGSTGMRLFGSALQGGALALGADAAEIAPDAPADLVALHDPFALETGAADVLDRWIFGRDIQVADVWSNGRHVVRAGKHLCRDAIQQHAVQVIRHSIN